MPARRPNIVFLLSDDHRWDLMGCMGHPVIKTSELDRLAADGTLFENAFATSPSCMPSRASILLGQFESRHRCGFDMDLTNRTVTRAEFANSYPVLLRNAGYRTGYAGKFGFPVTQDKVHCGGHAGLWTDAENMPSHEFDAWRGFPSQGSYFPRDDGTFNGYPNKYGCSHLTRFMAQQANEFIRNSAERDQPFCLTVGFKAPHGPREPDPAYGGLYDDTEIPKPVNYGDAYWKLLPSFIRNSHGRLCYEPYSPPNFQRTMAKYYQQIYGMDVAIGMIREQLETLGIADNTIIIYASDNGYFTGSKGLGCKVYAYEESARIPLIIFDPRLPKSQRGARVDRLAANIDFAPTMLDMAGVSAPDCMQGASMVPLLCQGAPEWRDSLFIENLLALGSMHTSARAEAAAQGVPYTGDRWHRHQSVRTNKWKYFRHFEQDPIVEELFDVEADPIEANNVAADTAYAADLAAMRRACDTWAERARARRSQSPTEGTDRFAGPAQDTPAPPCRGGAENEGAGSVLRANPSVPPSPRPCCRRGHGMECEGNSLSRRGFRPT